MNTDCGAIFSPCRRYRYLLWRRWADLLSGPDRYCMFIGLNPSTATETENDPTVTRCINYAKSWGYTGLLMTNLFAFRATDPEVMKRELEPIGEDNDKTLIFAAGEAAIVVAAWGVHGAHLNRGEAVRQMFPSLHCLTQTADGHPGHPLYLPKSLQPTPWIVR